MIDFKHIWQVITTPSCWLRNYSTNVVWDEHLNDLLDSEEVKVLSRSKIKLGKVVVWVGNYPYCYGEYDQMLPTRKTVFRLREAEVKARLKGLE